MDIPSLLISAALFAAFVPGVFVTLPGGASRMVTLGVHAVLFAVTTSLVMSWYWREGMGNYGVTCPNGYKMLPDQTCVPVGQSTYPAHTGFKSTQ